MSADMPGTRRLSYKFRIYPTEAQKKAIQANIDACRYVYNRLLRMRIYSYQATKPTLREHVLAPGADPESERPFRVPGGRGMLRVLAYVPMALILISIFFTAVPLSFDSETLSSYLPITIGSILSIVIGEILIAARARRHHS